MKEKIPFYNIVNMFFVGAVFSLCLAILLRNYIPIQWIKDNSELLSDWSILISSVLLVAMYELGFIINRMGSIIISPIYQVVKLWPKGKYGIDVSELAQVNPRFQSLITELNLMRSHIMMCILLLVVSVILRERIWIISLLLLIVIFTFGGKKHNEKINIMRADFAQRKSNAKQEVQNIAEYLANN